MGVIIKKYVSLRSEPHRLPGFVSPFLPTTRAAGSLHAKRTRVHAALTACARASFNSIEIASESIFFSAEARVPSNHVAFIRRVRATVRHGNRPGIIVSGGPARNHCPPATRTRPVREPLKILNELNFDERAEKSTACSHASYDCDFYRSQRVYRWRGRFSACQFAEIIAHLAFSYPPNSSNASSDPSILLFLLLLRTRNANSNPRPANPPSRRRVKGCGTGVAATAFSSSFEKGGVTGRVDGVNRSYAKTERDKERQEEAMTTAEGKKIGGFVGGKGRSGKTAKVYTSRIICEARPLLMSVFSG